MLVYGKRRNPESARDFSVGVSLAEEPQYRELASAEVILAVSLFELDLWGLNAACVTPIR